MSGLQLAAAAAVLWVLLATGQNQALPTEPPSVALAPDSSQNQEVDRDPARSDPEQKIWANAKTYVDLPIAEVTETNQEGLASLLGNLGQSCIDLLRHTPNLASHEEQITQQRGINRISEGAFVPLTNAIRRERREFGYLLLFRDTADGTELREYRTDKHGRPIVNARSQGGQMTVGFASEWLRLLPGNQPELRFRYLGREEMDGHKTMVIAFAQVPGHVRYPAQFSFDRTLITALFQGIVWVDASDFRLVRMREDLLAPRPDLHLSEMTTTIRFAEVQIPKAPTALWLPKEVTIAWEYKGIAVEQRHLYSDFRLYEVHSKIVPQ
jgi:hypothetical protein